MDHYVNDDQEGLRDCCYPESLLGRFSTLFLSGVNVAKTSVPRDHIFIDTETADTSFPPIDSVQRHKLVLGTACYARFSQGKWTRQKWLSFTQQDEFWTWLHAVYRKKTTPIIWACNVVFDQEILGLRKRIDTGEYVIPAMQPRPKNLRGRAKRYWRPLPFFVESPPTAWGVRHAETKRGWVLADTLNFLPYSVDSLGDMLEIPKLLYPLPDDGEQAWHAYCRRDVEIIMEAIRRLLTWHLANECGRFGWTLASNAETLYTTRLRDTPYIPHEIPSVRRLERAAYFGGQFECYRLGRVDQIMHQVDATGLYPYVMSQGGLPVKLIEYKHVDRRFAEFPDFLDKTYIADVLISTVNDEYPKRVKRGIVYPLGTYWTQLAGPELAVALERGQVLFVASWARYELGDPLGLFARTLWGLRDAAFSKGDEFGKRISKLLAVAMSGKIGQLNRRWKWVEDYGYCPGWHWWIDWGSTPEEFRELRSICGSVQERLTSDDRKKSFPALAAWITSAGRVFMRGVRSLCGAKHVTYQACDALHVTDEGLRRLHLEGKIRPRELGGFKIDSTAPWVVYQGLNHYRWGWQEVISGVRKEHEVLASNTYRDLRFEGVESLFSHAPNDSVEIKTVVHYRKDQYWQADVASESGRVKRFRIDETDGQCLPWPDTFVPFAR